MHPSSSSPASSTPFCGDMGYGACPHLGIIRWAAYLTCEAKLQWRTPNGSRSGVLRDFADTKDLLRIQPTPQQLVERGGSTLTGWALHSRCVWHEGHGHFNIPSLPPHTYTGHVFFCYNDNHLQSYFLDLFFSFEATNDLKNGVFILKNVFNISNIVHVWTKVCTYQRKTSHV